MALLVNPRSAHLCCKDCSVSYGHSPNGKAKKHFRRTLKRQERQGWKKLVKTES